MHLRNETSFLKLEFYFLIPGYYIKFNIPNKLSSISKRI